MTSCILFACSIFDEKRIFILRNFLESFKNNFKDCTIYVGINPGCLQSIESIIAEYNLDTVIGYVPTKLYSFSDASAYQCALQLLKDSNKQYDYYWFIHTKGGVNTHSTYLHTWYIHNLINDRNNIESFLSKYEGIGSYGLLGMEWEKNKFYEQYDTDLDLFTNTNSLPYTHAHFFYIHTLYVIKHIAIEKFFDLASIVWFNSKLDRYYFEGIFYLIVSRMGLFPYLANRTSNTGRDLYEFTAQWIRDNNLSKYEKYLDLYTVNFDFNQLGPSDVISNTQS